ncbi:MAG TPA: transcription elongation factor subunit Spt4 [Acidobacteriota bacterium]|nr:transcription elongation factor subunit Spt4 [Acidobacteriota bacterium]
MAKKQAGKFTKVLTTEDTSPLNPKEPLTSNWYGRVVIADSEKSTIAKKMGIAMNGEFAIKVR